MNERGEENTFALKFQWEWPNEKDKYSELEMFFFVVVIYSASEKKRK